PLPDHLYQFPPAIRSHQSPSALRLDGRSQRLRLQVRPRVDRDLSPERRRDIILSASPQGFCPRSFRKLWSRFSFIRQICQTTPNFRRASLAAESGVKSPHSKAASPQKPFVSIRVHSWLTAQ